MKDYFFFDSERLRVIWSKSLFIKWNIRFTTVPCNNPVNLFMNEIFLNSISEMIHFQLWFLLKSDLGIKLWELNTFKLKNDDVNWASHFLLNGETFKISTTVEENFQTLFAFLYYTLDFWKYILEHIYSKSGF